MITRKTTVTVYKNPIYDINIIYFQFNTTAVVSTLQDSTTEALANANQDTEISEEAYEDFSFVANVIVTPIICALGLTANSLGIGVLLRASRQEKLAIYVYLCSLTLLDSIFLSTGLLRASPNLIAAFDKYLANMIEQFSNLGFIYVDMVLTYTATYIIVVMAIERLMALVRPFSVKDSVLTKHPKKIVLICFVLNAIFLTPFPVNFEVASFQNEENRTEYYLRYRLHAVQLMADYEFVHTFVHNYVPGCIMLVVNIAIPVAFSRILKRRSALKTSSSATGQQAKITLAVLCITVLYFLFSIPDSFIKTRAYFDEDYSFSGKYRMSFWLFVDISNLFTYLNAANDFVIYILVSDHYRRIFREMYCQCLITRDANSAANSNETGSTSVPEKKTDKY